MYKKIVFKEPCMNKKQWKILFKAIIHLLLSSCVLLNGMNVSQEEMFSATVGKGEREESVGVVEQAALQENHWLEDFDEEERVNADNQDIKKIREDEQERVRSLFAAAQQGILSTQDIRSPDLFIRDEKGFTLLHYASYKGHRAVVELLLDGGAYIGAVSQGGLTALHWAARLGHRAVVELLLARGAQIDAVTHDCLTARHLAAMNGHRGVVERLLERGAQIGTVDKGGWTALHWAAMNGHREVVELLVGRMMLKPTDEQVAKARAQIGKVLLWQKLGKRVCAHRLPKDIVGYMLLLNESLCSDFAIILLRKCNRAARIDTTSCLVNNKVLFCAAQMILAENGAMLDDVYKKLPENAQLKSLFAPLDREKNLRGCIREALTKKIQSSQ